MRFILGLCLLAVVGCGDDGGGSTDAEAEKGTLQVPPLTQCKFHLQNLHAASQEYKVTYGHLSWYTGASYWASLAFVSPPIIAGSELSWFDCPVSAFVPSPGWCEYRGPNGDANVYPDFAPVGADKVGAHGIGQGGHVVLKNGQVILCAETDYLWILASSYTSP